MHVAPVIVNSHSVLVNSIAMCAQLGGHRPPVAIALRLQIYIYIYNINNKLLHLTIFPCFHRHIRITLPFWGIGILFSVIKKSSTQTDANINRVVLRTLDASRLQLDAKRIGKTLEKHVFMCAWSSHWVVSVGGVYLPERKRK